MAVAVDMAAVAGVATGVAIEEHGVKVKDDERYSFVEDPSY
jgi:hypothetical protein